MVHVRPAAQELGGAAPSERVGRHVGGEARLPGGRMQQPQERVVREAPALARKLLSVGPSPMSP